MAAPSSWTIVVFLLLAVIGCGPAEPKPVVQPRVRETYEVERTDFKSPPPVDDGLTDDSLDAKKPVFATTLIDRRPDTGWLINQSAAVLRIDTPMVYDQPALRTLYPSYQVALNKAGANDRGHNGTLPSVNLLDGRAKQFDDGLYAAIDLAWFRGQKDHLQSHIDLARKLLAKVGPGSPAAAYLAAGLTLGGVETDVPARAARDKWIHDFERNPALSKPIGFYTSNDDLQHCWRFMRFFQQSLKEGSPEAKGLVAALAADEGLKGEYERHVRFFGRLTNPLSRLTLADLVGVDVASEVALADLRRTKSVRRDGVSFFPPSNSRETELFAKLFPLGVPDDANLMKELIGAIRSGKVDLTPRGNSGWYDHQVFALESLLEPSKAEETQKLLLTKSYKRRMLQAFEALITKRRETHVRSLDRSDYKSADDKAASDKGSPPPPKNFAPRLRLEPCPTFYIRTARSYAFLETFLTASLGEESLKSLHGLKQDGARPLDLATDLAAQRDLFYGLYLVSCDDIGLAPKLTDGEVKNVEECCARANAWLMKAYSEPELATDTRVAVPIYIDYVARKTRLWVTLGVRLSPLDVSFARPPSVRAANDDKEWEQVDQDRLLSSSYLIAVAEYAEVEVPTLAPPTREEFRKLCDQHVTKDKILAALREGKW